MKSSIETQWQRYKELELIPDSTPIPSANLAVQIRHFWRSLSDRTQPPLYRAQQVKHLKTCWKLDICPSHPNLWQSLEERLNQFFSTCKSLSSNEPEVHQVTDQGGRVWWYAHDPLTGQTTYLESEEEVQVWLEERLYYNYR
jgi:hypothetical protein